MDRRSARRAVLEYHRSRPVAHGRRPSRRRIDGALRRICRRHAGAHGTCGRLPGSARGRARILQAQVQREHALRPREYVALVFGSALLLDQRPWLSVRIILPVAVPEISSSIAFLASSSGKVYLITGSIFFSLSNSKIFGMSSRKGFGSFL